MARPELYYARYERRTPVGQSQLAMMSDLSTSAPCFLFMRRQMLSMIAQGHLPASAINLVLDADAVLDDYRLPYFVLLEWATSKHSLRFAELAYGGEVSPSELAATGTGPIPF